MNIFTQTTGEGPDVVLLHGWGMNADVWEEIVASLETFCRVTVVDLPGHGRSEGELKNYSLTNISRQVVDTMPAQSVLIGWSLGGLVATQLVLDYPDQFKKLVLVASAPQFTKDESWPEGIEPEVLDSFAGDMQEDYRKTMKRFIAIQVAGSDNAREQQRVLRDRVFRHGHPDQSALEGGLKILHEANLRPRLSDIRCPTLLIAGQYDTLFRPEAAEQTHRLIDDSKLVVVKGAGHAPFLSHKKEFLSALTVFLQYEKEFRTVFAG